MNCNAENIIMPMYKAQFMAKTYQRNIQLIHPLDLLGCWFFLLNAHQQKNITKCLMRNTRIHCLRHVTSLLAKSTNGIADCFYFVGNKNTLINDTG